MGCFRSGLLISATAFGLLAWRSQTSAVSLGWFLAGMGVAWCGALLAWWAGRNGHPAPAWREMVLWALLLRAAAFACEPLLEDDPWRYVWDGYRTVLTGNPYGYPPADSFSDPDVPSVMQPVLDRINHPDLPTVYGPVAQTGFAVSHLVSPGALWPWKVIVGVSDLAVLMVFLRLRLHSAALFWSVCPLVLQATWASAHLDALAVACLIGSVVSRDRPVLCGLLLALAVGTRPIALLAVPWICGTAPRAWIAFAISAALVHAPFLVTGGYGLSPEFARILNQWEFNSSVFALVADWTGPSAARVLCVSMFAFGYLALWFTPRARIKILPREGTTAVVWPPGDILFGLFWLLSPVVNAWYLLWVAPFVALRPTPVGVVALIAVTLSYVTGLRLGDPSLGNFEHPSWLRPVEYGAVVAAGIIQVVCKQRRFIRRNIRVN